jgi:hypothetical protein
VRGQQGFGVRVSTLVTRYNIFIFSMNDVRRFFLSSAEKSRYSLQTQSRTGYKPRKGGTRMSGKNVCPNFSLSYLIFFFQQQFDVFSHNPSAAVSQLLLAFDLRHLVLSVFNSSIGINLVMDTLVATVIRILIIISHGRPARNLQFKLHNAVGDRSTQFPTRLDLDTKFHANESSPENVTSFPSMRVTSS